MGFLDRLFGRRPSYDQRYDSPYSAPQPGPAGGWASGPTGGGYPQDRVGGGGARRSQDEEAIARYRYLLETAPPEQIEAAHAEAFSRLTPEQRRQVLGQLAEAGESSARTDDPRSLARAATRLEMRRPGSLFGAFGGSGRGGTGMGGMGMGRGMGMGGLGMGMGGLLLTSVAGSFVGSAIAGEMLDNDGFMDWDTNGDQGESFADGGGSDGGGYDDGGAADAGFADQGLDGGGFDGGGFDGGDFGSF